MLMTRKKYTEEFKREAVRLMETRGERTVADVAKSLGVAENVLHAWRKHFGSQIANTSAESEAQELKRLRREVAELKREREILKKAAALWYPHECDLSPKCFRSLTKLCEVELAIR